MTDQNIEKLRSAFVEALHLPAAKVVDTLAYNSLPEWDSVGHMVLVTAIESAFDVMLDTNDIIDMSSFAKAQEILARYGIVF